jgi:peptidoglycan/LPS O-acetylase OafA/YrhL
MTTMALHGQTAPPPAHVLPAPGTHIPALDGIRGLAVLMVMVCHFTSTGLPDTFAGKFVHRITGAGCSGVDLFFVLSGFLITGILYDAKNESHYFRAFYARRFLRIFPLYYGFLIVFFWVLPLVHPFTPAMQHMAARQGWLWAYSSNFIMAWEGHWLFVVDWMDVGHFWTLAVEEQFYLVWPLAVFLLSRRALIRVCVACMVAALVIRTGLVMHGARPITVGLLTFSRFDALAVGGLAALLLRGRPVGLFGAARRITALSGVGMFILSLWRRGWNASDPFVQAFGYSMLALFCAGILILVMRPHEDNTLARRFSHPFLRWFGTYSYAMYVFHVALMPLYQRIFPLAKLSTALNSTYLGVGAYVVLSIAGTTSAAYLSWHLYEKHFLKLKKHFSPHRVTTVSEPVANTVLAPAGSPGQMTAV